MIIFEAVSMLDGRTVTGSSNLEVEELREELEKNNLILTNYWKEEHLA